MFSYILKRIEEADFSACPFRHVYLDGLFTSEHLADILASPEITIPQQPSDKALFQALYRAGYGIIGFPGCITSERRYRWWHRRRAKSTLIHSAVEGFGVTLRLKAPATPIIRDLIDFLSGDAFNDTIARKFGVSRADTYIDNGIQKYLDGYEISPHPDIRRKALTYMVNINPWPEAAKLDHHTHYMKLKPAHAHVETFWRNNPDCERAWVPWDWCETAFQQPVNNSMVLFAPSDNTIHAVRARYDHLKGQRTQLYGNLWFNDNPTLQQVPWEVLDVRRQRRPTRLKKLF